MTSDRDTLDRDRLRRHAFDARADEYRLARPPYPAEVYELLADRCGLAAGTRVLEIGAGTGLATGPMLARGADVVAVEPGDGMVGHLAADFAGHLNPSAGARGGRGWLRIVHSDFEHAELASEGFDLAVSATAFHWVPREVALPKLASLLRPSGSFVVWWNVFSDPTQPTQFRYALDELYRTRLPHVRRSPTDVPGPLRTASWTEELQLGGWFEVVEAHQLRWDHQLTADGARRLFGSFSNVNELAAGQREEFLDAIGDLIDVSFGGVVRDPYVTAVYVARRPGRPGRRPAKHT